MTPLARILLLVTLTCPSLALAVPFDLSAGGDFFFSKGNAGTGLAPDPLISATKSGITLSLTALSGVADGGNLDLSIYNPDGDNPLGLPGTVRFEDKGAGSQGNDAGGSKEISGKGPLGDEVLLLDFMPEMRTAATLLTLSKYKFGKSEALIYLDNTTLPQLGSAIIDANLQEVAKDTFVLDFGAPQIQAALSGIDSFTTLYVRASDHHFLLNGIDVTAVVPEPTALLLLATAIVGLGALRRPA